MTNISEIILLRRKRLGLSIKELAEKCNLSVLTVSNAERGRNIELASLMKILDGMELVVVIQEKPKSFIRKSWLEIESAISSAAREAINKEELLP